MRSGEPALSEVEGDLLFPQAYAILESPLKHPSSEKQVSRLRKWRANAPFASLEITERCVNQRFLAYRFFAGKYFFSTDATTT
jgi:hypothetical protein